MTYKNAHCANGDRLEINYNLIYLAWENHFVLDLNSVMLGRVQDNVCQMNVQ